MILSKECAVLLPVNLRPVLLRQSWGENELGLRIDICAVLEPAQNRVNLFPAPLQPQ